MNRKKKINQSFNQKTKKAKAMMPPSKKPRYISKADRAAAANQLVEGSCPSE